MVRSVAVAVIAAAVGFFFCACSGVLLIDQESTQGPTDPSGPVACVADGDCTSDQSCVASACVSTNMLCSANRPNGICDAGLMCDGTECVLAGFLDPCSLTAPFGTCDTGETCDGITCVPYPGNDACAPQNPRGLCPAREFCDAGTCEAVADICSASSLSGQCPGRTVCYQGQCETQICGNAAIEAFEDCEGTNVGADDCTTLGFTAGNLGCYLCQFDTSGCYICGDGMVTGLDEPCDGTALGGMDCTGLEYTPGRYYSGGNLACTAACEYDTTGCGYCGDGGRNAGEDCEGSDFGGTVCADFSGPSFGRFSGGDMTCTANCRFNVTYCTFCGDGDRNGDEVCELGDLGGTGCIDVGFTGGNLICTPFCDFDTTFCTECGDGLRNGIEDCEGADLGGTSCAALPGFSGGTLACDASCGFDTSGCIFCGDGTRNGIEDCEGADLGGLACADLPGFNGGSLGCAGDCTYDTATCTFCGDGVRNGIEACDATDLNGTACTDLAGFTGGALACASYCQYDTSGCFFCGDGNRNGTEDCEQSDLGGLACADIGAFTGGNLLCTGNCAYDTSQCTGCGDGVQDPGESCDGADLNGRGCTDFGGYTGGALGCDPLCNFDFGSCTACGDGTRNGNEVCEGVDLGGVQCTDIAGPLGPPFTGGALACDGSCGFDTGACVWCGDTLRNGSEACEGGNLGGAVCTDFPGYTGGALSCAADCTYDKALCTYCGDGTRNGTEQCEGTNLGGADCVSQGFSGGTLLCNGLCQYDTRACSGCGNNVREAGEVCDGTDLAGTQCANLVGFTGGTLQCAPLCKAFDTSGCSFCGDGTRNGNESCEGTDLGTTTCLDLPGFTGGTLACDGACAFDTTGCTSCGDGTRNGNEQCEGADVGTSACTDFPGFTGGTLGCGPTCQFDNALCTYCGDGTRNGNELCELNDLGGESCVTQGFSSGTLLCSGLCDFITTFCYPCGDGIRNPGELCDGADLNSTVCTDLTGFTGGTLACDGSCNFNTAGCSFCGDGTRNGNEACEGTDVGGLTCLDIPGKTGGTLGCDASCNLDSTGCFFCGDGARNGNEACEGADVGTAACTDYPGFSGGNIACDPSCSLDTAPCFFCGNGTNDATEDCEGADLGGATCSTLGFNFGTLSCSGACTYDSTWCSDCGDGVVAGREVCDGSDLRGQTCVSQFMQGGTLVCAPDCLTYDTTGCGVQSFTIVPTITSMTVLLGASGTQQFNAQVTFNDGSTQIVTAQWFLSDPNAGNIDGTGLFTSNSALTADTQVTVIAVWAGQTATMPFTVIISLGSNICGNGVLEAPEACDGADLGGLDCTTQGFFGGTLGCNTDCTINTSLCHDCGDAVVQSPPEDCEAGQLGGATCISLGFSAGALACATDCTYDTTACTIATCGNTTIEGIEQCDGGNLNGGDCVTQGFTAGTLVCNGNCQFDTSLCTTCGNNIAETGENCDGFDLGGADCTTAGFDAGVLGCLPDCTFDTSACTMVGSPLDNLTQIDLTYTCTAANPPTDCPDTAGTITITVDENGGPSIDLDAIGSFDDNNDGVTDRQVDITSLSAWTLADAGGGAYNSALGSFDPVTGVFIPGGAAGTVILTAAADGSQTNCALQGQATTGFDLCRTYRIDIVVDAGFTAQPAGDIPFPIPVPASPEQFFVDGAGNDYCPGNTTVCCNGVNACTAAPAPVDLPFIVYPNDQVLLPRNIFQLLMQWNRGQSDNQVQYNLFRARFRNILTQTEVSVYTTADRWRPDATVWSFVTLTNAGGHVDFSIEAVALTCGESNCTDGIDNDGDTLIDEYVSSGSVFSVVDTVRINLSAADVPGAIYYWSTAVEGIKKASINSNVPINFYWPSTVAASPPGAGVGSKYEDFSAPVYVPDANMKCFACHGMSRDGTQLAGSYDHQANGKTLNNVDLSGQVAATNAGEPDLNADGLPDIAPNHVRELGHILAPAGPVWGPSQIVQPVTVNIEFPTFDDTGTMIAGGKGDIFLISSSTGEQLGINPVPVLDHPGGNRSKKMHADFSPDGRWLAWAYEGKGKGAGIGVISFDKSLPPPAPNSSDNRWGGNGTLLIDGEQAGTFADWHYPVFSPNSLWLVINKTDHGLGEKNKAESRLAVLEWAECDPSVIQPAGCPVGTFCDCRPIPKCDAPTDTVPPDLPDCVPVELTRINEFYNNCNRGGPWAACPSPALWQTNMPRWAPTNKPDVFFLVFTSWRPYGKVSGEILGNQFAATGDQLWVGGFDQAIARAGGDGSFPPFWLPFQFFSETNHRAFWTHDPGGGFGGCSPEICDGLDNDCDGIVDNGCCIPLTETCDGVDNDCNCPGDTNGDCTADTNGDGVVCGPGDAGVCTCGVGEPPGVCALGDVGVDEALVNGVMVDGAACCIPSAEICDGVDNDCDGLVDEGCPTCTPAPEICDGADNDCDGIIDAADLDVVPNAGCPPACACCTAEICNGIDDDCNGLLDGADPGVTFPVGKTCCFPGTFDGPGTPPSCGGVTDCWCNGVDDDCDGIVDNGCCIPDTPPIEVCDGRDNDCDGLVDEADPDLGPGACCPDADFDGFTTCNGDCNDADPTINPGVPETDFVNCVICDDGIDQDCDGFDCTCCADNDGDSYTDCAGDCNDADPSINPGVLERDLIDCPICNDGIDQNCDGADCTCCVDADGDGYTDCAGDCNDNDPAIHPGLSEADFVDCPICDDGIDQNCDGSDCTCCADVDLDGWTDCAGDCNDNAANVNPGIPETDFVTCSICDDGVDNNCDGSDCTCCPDADGDGWTTCQGDCNDADAGINPSVPELDFVTCPICDDGIDQNCDLSDCTCCNDIDGDGWTDCAGDCNDNDATINPGIAEQSFVDCPICDDSIDQNCDGPDCTCCTDADGDNWSTCQGDCNDTDASINPSIAETDFVTCSICNDTIDQNCDGVDCTCCVDNDGDGWTDCAGDCNDANANINPGVTEVDFLTCSICDNSIDENCDTLDCTCCVDADGDGWTDCQGDCNDNDASINPGVSEVSFVDCPICDDGIDQSCDGSDCTCCADVDGDGWTTCAGDCNDNVASINPGVPEMDNVTCSICDDTIDQNCDGTDCTCCNDLDGDGWTDCAGDCIDTNPNINPGVVEQDFVTCLICDDSIDQNCDGSDCTCCVDADGDGYTDCAGDCNDADPNINPGINEVDFVNCLICDDSIDQDCNGADCTCCADADGDGWTDCQGDCNDANPNINPGIPEVNNLTCSICGDTIDQNCDGVDCCCGEC